MTDQTNRPHQGNRTRNDPSPVPTFLHFPSRRADSSAVLPTHCCSSAKPSLRTSIAVSPSTLLLGPLAPIETRLPFSRRDLRYRPLSLRWETMSPSLGIKLGGNLHEQPRLFRRSQPGTQHISHSHPRLQFLTGLRQLKAPVPLD